VTPRIEWAALTQHELEALLTAGRAEGTRRVRSLLALMGAAVGSEGKRGRKPADPFAAALSDLTGEGAEDQEDAAVADSGET
jgi:hypothetical protein